MTNTLQNGYFMKQTKSPVIDLPFLPNKIDQISIFLIKIKSCGARGFW